MPTNTAKAIFGLRGLTALFDNAIKQVAAFYPDVCLTLDSQGSDEGYAMLGSMPGVREWLGDRIFNELRGATFVVENKHWESSLRIAKTDLADDRLGAYKIALPQLAVEAALHPDELLFGLIANGDTAACFDGSYFFDTDHSWGSSGTQSNALTFPCTDPDAPTTAEVAAAYEAARLALMGFSNDQGKPFTRPLVPDAGKFMALTPATLQKRFAESFLAEQINATSNVVVATPSLKASTYLTAGRKFYTFNLGTLLRPFVFQAREPLARQIKGADDIETKDALFMTEARYNIGLLAWWLAVETTFVSA
jgi:phage major head subunit gpT-like protein